MRRVGNLGILLCLLALSAGLSAQQYAFHAYRQAEGLKNLSVTDLATDKKGFLWVGSEDGVYRFLRSGFQRFGPEEGIADVSIEQILADSSGTVWVGTQTDLYRWDRSRFRPAAQTPISILGRRRMAEEDATHLLVIDGGRLCRLQHDATGRLLSYVPVLQAETVAAIPALGRLDRVRVISLPNGTRQIWVASKSSLFSLDEAGANAQPGALKEWDAANGLPRDRWEDVFLDHDGRLWVAGMKHVLVLPRGSTHFIDLKIPEGERESPFGHAPLMEDPMGHMLVPAGNSLARWTGSGWKFFDHKNGWARVSSILGMVFDGAGNLFIASRGDGVYEWPGYGAWEAWGNDQGLPSSSIWNIVPTPGGRLFVGTDHGVGWVDPASGDAGPMGIVSRWSFGRVSAMGTNRDGSLWLASSPGQVLRMNPHSGAVQTTQTLPVHIVAGFQDSGGRAFLFTGGGVYVREDNAPASTFRRDAALEAVLPDAASLIVNSWCEGPDGSVWVVINNHVVRNRDGRWSLPAIDNLPKLAGTVMGMAADGDGGLWLTGDQTGTWYMRPDHGRFVAERIKLPEELASLACLTVLRDRRGWLWLATELGMAVWNGTTWRHLTEQSGLIWNDTNEGVLREDKDGSIWIGTNGGLAHLIHPEHVFDPVTLRVAITQIQNGKQDLTGSEHIELRENGPPLAFQVASPSMRNGGELTLRVRMAGMNTDWLQSSDGKVEFHRLRAGSYILVTKACDPVIDSCSAPETVAVTVLPAWWNSWWFRTLIGLVAVLLGFVLIRLYGRHLQQRSMELERLVAERTSELEASREMLRVQATHDGLTGLPNRNSVLGAMNDELERARREEKSIVVALVDIDHFKKINDEYGHLVGDKALRQFANAMRTAIRPYDHCGRYGGEEFLIVLTNLPADAAEQRLESIHSSISGLPVRLEHAEFHANCSMGAVATVPTRATDPEWLLSAADEALYEAKATGRNRAIIRHV